MRGPAPAPISRVEVSADGGPHLGRRGAVRAGAAAGADALSRLAWKWNGAPAVLKSRATDEHRGECSPSATSSSPLHGSNVIFHYNAHPGVERVGRRGGEECLRVTSPCRRRAGGRAAARRVRGPTSPRRRREVRRSADPPRRRRSPPGTSAFRPTAPACRPGSGTPAQGASCTRRNARPATATKAPASPTTGCVGGHGTLDQHEPGAHDRQLLAVRHHGVRLRAPGDAVHAAAVAERRGRLRGHGVSPASQRDHRRSRT